METLGQLFISLYSHQVLMPYI